MGTLVAAPAAQLSGQTTQVTTRRATRGRYIRSNFNRGALDRWYDCKIRGSGCMAWINSTRINSTEIKSTDINKKDLQRYTSHMEYIYIECESQQQQ